MNLSHQRILLILGALAIAGGVAWFFASHRREVVLEQQLPKDLISDPWAASRQFLTSMGMESHESIRLDDILDKAQDEDIVILDLSGPSPSTAQLERLRYWVRGGGRLIVETDGPEIFASCILPSWGLGMPDSLRMSGADGCDWSTKQDWKDTRIKSRRTGSEDDSDANEDEDEGEGEDDSSTDSDGSGSLLTAPVSKAQSVLSDPDPTPRVAWTTVRLEDMDSTRVRDSLRNIVPTSDTAHYRVDTYSNDSLAWSDEPPRHTFRDPGGFVLMGSLKEGTIVVVEDFTPFKYGRLAEWDHASLLWQLVGSSAEGQGLWIARRARLESWLRMLAVRMPLAIFLAAVTLALAMWAAATRFGPVLVAKSEEKTGIIDHAEGAGRWLWQFPGGRAKLLAALQDSARRKQLRTHPELVGADPKTLGKALEADGLGQAAALQDAFDPTTETSPKQFLSVAKTLWSLRRNR